MSGVVSLPEVVVREGGAADTDRILELVRVSLGEGLVPRDPEYWRWKHLENPFGESPMLLAEAEGQLVGLRVFMPWGWHASGRPIRAVRAVDTATHPAWQGRGIFRKLTLELVERMRAEGVAFVFNTPNAQSRPGYLKMGWGAVGRLDLWIRPLRPLRTARLLAGQRRGAAREGTPDVASGGPGTPLDELFATQPGLPEWLDATALPDPVPRLTVRRTAEYLRWRYAAVPGFRYHAVAELDGEAGALVVFRYKDQRPLTELRVCELVVRPGARSRRIARGLLAWLRAASDVDYMSAMASAGTVEQRVLLRAGFLPAPRLGPILTVRPLAPLPAGVDPLRRRAWRASLGDLELF